MKNRESISRGCPYGESYLWHDEVILSTNLDYLRDIVKINLLAPAANMRRVTRSDEREDGKRFIPWFAPDNDLAKAIALRKNTYFENPNRVLGTRNNDPTIRAVGEQLLELQAHYLADQFPDMYEVEDFELGQLVRNKMTGDSFNLRPTKFDLLHPLAVCGLLGQEDICVVEKMSDGRQVLVGGFLASPTNWNLSMFMGADMDEIHKDVNGYTDKLKDTVDKSLANLPEYPTRQFARNNMFMKLDPALGLVPEAHGEIDPKDIDDSGSQIFLRSEYETLTRLPSTDKYPDGNKFTIFTIKPHVYPLSVVASIRGEELAAASRTNTKLQSYPFLTAAQDYLERIKATATN